MSAACLDTFKTTFKLPLLKPHLYDHYNYNRLLACEKQCCAFYGIIWLCPVIGGRCNRCCTEMKLGSSASACLRGHSAPLPTQPSCTGRVIIISLPPNDPGHATTRRRFSIIINKRPDMTSWALTQKPFTHLKSTTSLNLSLPSPHPPCSSQNTTLTFCCPEYTS